MTRIKTKEEIEILRAGGRILASILNEISEMALSRAETGEMERKVCALIEKAHGRPAFKNLAYYNGFKFPTALCISINDEIVHCPALPSRKLQEGDVVGLDIGMEYPISGSEKHFPKNKHSELGGYYTDMAKTVIVGEGTKRAEELVATAKKALDLAIEQVKPGNTLDDIGRVVEDCAREKGFSVVRDLVGHGVGHEVHEEPQVPNYRIKGSGLENAVLKTGMVIAIEPMINVGGHEIRTKEDRFSIATRDGQLSAHFEHTVAVTEEGHLVITEV